MFIGFLYAWLGEMSVQVLCPFLNWIVLFILSLGGGWVNLRICFLGALHTLVFQSAVSVTRLVVQQAWGSSAS